MVITFDRHPLKTLAPHAAPRSLMTIRQRLDRIAALKFHGVFVLEFNRRLAALTADSFVRSVLVRRLRVTHLTVGYDFHFGKGGAGDAGTLTRLGRLLGFSVKVIPPVLCRGEPISSTRIRRLVSMGNMREAAVLLGRPVTLTGPCRKGKRLGRTLGFPTINIVPANELLPPYGVYAVRYGQNRKTGVANLGTRPTVSRANQPLLEVHILGKAPGRRPAGCVDVELIKFLRPERRFQNLSVLKHQIARDAANARRFFRKGS